MNLVRKILLAMEADPAGYAMSIVVDGYDQKTVGYHVYLMAQAKLITANDFTSMAEDTPNWAPLSLTWEGDEFLAASREPVIWERAFGLAKSVGNTAFPIIMQALTKAALDKLEKIV